MNAQLARYTGTGAFISGFASIIALVSLLLFFSLEASISSMQRPHFWGPISDIAPIFQMLSLLFVAIVFYFMLRTGALRLSLMICMIGMAGMLGVVMLQTLLRLYVLSFEQEIMPLLFATAFVGVWLVMISILGRRQRALSSQLAWLGIAVGTAFILEPIIFRTAGGATDWRVLMPNYFLLGISAVVFLVSYLGFPVWAFWLGRVFFNMYRGR